MPDHECPPPGGGGLAVPPNLNIPNFWYAGYAYIPWESDVINTFIPTLVSTNKASGHIVAYDGMFKRKDADLAVTQADVEVYLLERGEFLTVWHEKLAEARTAFEQQAGVPFPQYPTGGVVLNADGPLSMGARAQYIPFSYPDNACRCDVDHVGPLIVTATFSSGNGWRTIRGPRVVHLGAEYQQFQDWQAIWVPLYNAALAESKAQAGAG